MTAFALTQSSFLLSSIEPYCLAFVSIITRKNDFSDKLKKYLFFPPLGYIIDLAFYDTKNICQSSAGPKGDNYGHANHHKFTLHAGACSHDPMPVQAAKAIRNLGGQ